MSEEFIKLYRAIVFDDQKVYTELRNSNTDVNISLKETIKHSEDTLLHVAANWNRRHIAEILIDLRPSLLLATNAKGETPLHAAASAGSEAVTRVIIERCHQIEARETGEIILRKKSEKEKETALHKAVRNGHLEVVKLLIHEDLELTKLVNKDGDSPLFMAVDTMRFEIARNILTISNCSFKGRANMNALHAAIAHRYSLQDAARGIVSCLIQKKGAGILEQQDGDHGWTPLHYAARMNDTQTIQQLVKAEHSVAFIKDKNGMTALHIAAKKGHVRAVEKLVEICHEICGIVDDNGQSFFHIAVKSGRTTVVLFILGKRYYLLFDFLSYIFLLRILHCIIGSYFGGFRGKIFADDFLNMQDYQGNTALHLAASKRQFFILVLLARDRSICRATINNDGLTYLDILVQSPMLTMTDVVGTLIAGGNPGIKHLLGSKEIKISEKKADESSDMQQINLLIATIIATVSFAAALQVPGGFKSDGTAVLAQKSGFRAFVIFNTIAFGLSVTTMIMSRYTHRLKSFYDNVMSVISQLATSALIVAFLFGSYAVLGPSEAKLIYYVGYITMACTSPLWYAVFFLVLAIILLKSIGEHEE